MATARTPLLLAMLALALMMAPTIMAVRGSPAPSPTIVTSGRAIPPPQRRTLTSTSSPSQPTMTTTTTTTPAAGSTLAEGKPEVASSRDPPQRQLLLNEAVSWLFNALSQYHGSGGGDEPVRMAGGKPKMRDTCMLRHHIHVDCRIVRGGGQWAARGLSTARPDFAVLPPALRVFRARYGHVLVPYSFPIAKDDDGGPESWPESLRGVNLGRRLHSFMTNAAHQRRFPHVLEELQALGLPTDGDWRGFIWTRQLLPALRAFRELQGHTLVPVDFVVPSSTGNQQTRRLWPIETHGLPLGRRVARLREKRDKLRAEELEDLEALDFAFDVDEMHWEEVIRPALETFRVTHRHCHVKRDFVVPRAAPWPSRTWGLRLGLVLHNIRVHDTYSEQIGADAARLAAMGWTDLVGLPDVRWREVIVPALRTFAALHGHCDLPATFVVPASVPWPEAAWGFSLGHLVHSPTAARRYAEQLERDGPALRKLGVTWLSPEEKWSQQILPALRAFVNVHPDRPLAKIPRRFVVPAEAPWPTSAWGLPLGDIVGRIRTRGHFAQQVAQDATISELLGLGPFDPKTDDDTA